MNRCCAVLFLCACLTGCSSDTSMPAPKSVVPVSGVVTMDGKPLDFARVTFVPQGGSEQSYGASGSTDSAGKYEMMSLVGNEGIVGAPPGPYKVTITRMVKPDGTVVSPDKMEPPMMSAARMSLPMQYGSTDTTPLEVTVSTTGGTYNFDLKSK